MCLLCCVSGQLASSQPEKPDETVPVTIYIPAHLLPQMVQQFSQQNNNNNNQPKGQQASPTVYVLNYNHQKSSTENELLSAHNSAAAANPVTGSAANPVTGSAANPVTGSRASADAAAFSEPVTGSQSNPITSAYADPTIGGSTSSSDNANNPSTSINPNFNNSNPGGGNGFFSGGARTWKQMLFSKQGLTALACITGISYAATYYSLKKAEWLIGNKEAWCNWKYELTLTELYSLTRHDLAAELLQAIQKKYINPKNPADHVTPLVTFLEQYDAEIAVFKRYFLLAKWIKRLRLTRFFPLSDQTLLAIKDRIERLAYLRSTFFGWITEYKTTRCTASHYLHNDEHLPAVLAG